MKTLTVSTIIILIISPLFLTAQTKIDQSAHNKIRSILLNRAFDLSNRAASGDRDYVFKPDSIRISGALDEAHPDDIEHVATIAIQWNLSNVKEMHINYIDPLIPDEDFIYFSDPYVSKITESGTNNFYTFSYNFKGEMTAMSYYSDGSRIYGDSLSYETFIKYHRHYKYDNGWKPYVIYSDVVFPGADIEGFTVETFDETGASTTYKYENTSFTNGQDKLFFKPLTFDMILDNYSLEEDFFLERPSDNILAHPIRYQKYKKNEISGDFELVEKSYAQYVQGINLQRYSYTGNDSTKIFDGNLKINSDQKIESYTYTDGSGGSHSGAYEYNDEKYVTKETVKAGNVVTSSKEYIYTPDDQDGLLSFEYRFRDEEGEGETELLEFRYIDPLKTNVLNARPIEVYPNPSFKEITFEFPGRNEECRSEIIDVNGGILESMNLSFKSGKAVLDISKLNAGSYTIIVKSKDGFSRSTFVKL